MVLRNVLTLAGALTFSLSLSSALAAGAGPTSGLNVNVVNTPANPVPVTGSISSSVTGSVQVTNTANNPIPVTMNGTGKVQTTSNDSTDLLLDTFLDFETTAATSSVSIDVSGYKSVRVLGNLGDCFLCNTTRIRIRSDFFPIDSFDVPFVNDDAFNFDNTYFSRVYETPGQTLTVSGASAVSGASSGWSIRVYGRRN